MYDMDETLLGTLVFSGLLLGALGINLLYYFKHNKLNPEGKGADRQTRRMLKNYAGIRRFKVLGDVRLEAGDGPVLIENLMVGFFGVLMVHTLGARGEYYGTLDGENWYVDLDDKRTAYPNPVREQKRAEAALRGLFTAARLYKIPIESVVYLSSRSKKTGLFITHNGEIIMPGKLGSYLDKTKFEKDLGLDVEAIAGVIAAAALPERNEAG